MWDACDCLRLCRSDSVQWRRCCDSLRQLKAIPTTYRMTSKPMPFRPSPYAGTVQMDSSAMLACCCSKFAVALRADRA